jgi:hypothetical protein
MSIPFEDPYTVPGNESPLRVYKPALCHHLCPLLLRNPRLDQNINVPLSAWVREDKARAEFDR